MQGFVRIKSVTEIYSKCYALQDEVFTNIYPQIVDAETYNKVRSKILNNKYGKHSDDVTYLLKEKLYCGYFGMNITSENGTARNGERKYYYKCRGRKEHLTDCHKQAIRKDVIEKIVLESVIEHLQKSNNVEYIVSALMQEQERQAQANVVLNLLRKEQRITQNSIQNIMTAIENGGTTNTVMKRMRELEARQSELEKQIVIEKSKTAIKLTEKQIRQYYVEALALEPKLLINSLVKKVILFDDKIQIIYNSPIKQSPEKNNRGFLICTKTVKLSFKTPFRTNLIRYEFELEMYV